MNTTSASASPIPDVTNAFDIAQAAQICYAANRAYRQTVGEPETVSWDKLPQAARDSYLNGVLWRVNNLDAPPSAQHEEWLKAKAAKGWTYGPQHSEALRTHPCLRPYEELPVNQRIKDALFIAIVRVMANDAL